MIHKWEIYFCSLNPAKGSEQRGTRPVLVISNNAVNHALPISTVLPLSSFAKEDKIYPTEIILPSAQSGLPKDSVAMIQQIRTVAHARLTKLVGKVANEEIQREIAAALKAYFEL